MSAPGGNGGGGQGGQGNGGSANPSPNATVGSVHHAKPLGAIIPKAGPRQLAQQKHQPKRRQPKAAK